MNNSQREENSNFASQERSIFAKCADFSNQYIYLSSHEKATFLAEVRTFFERKAYLAEYCTIPDAYQERFAKSDLPILLGTNSLPAFERRRLLAIIEKVTRCHFNGLHKAFQIVQLETDHYTPHGSAKLATSWNWASAIDCSPPEVEVKAELSGAPVSGWEKALIIHSRDNDPSLFFNSQFNGSLAHEFTKGVANLDWAFDPAKPIESIMRFTDHHPVLCREDQGTVFMNIHRFVISMAIADKSLEIPAEYRERFCWIDMLFLSDFHSNCFHSGENIQFEKHRFIAAIQKVTGLQFTTLKESDQVYLVRLRYLGQQAIPQDTFSCWLMKEFVQDSIFKDRLFSSDQELDGAVKAEPITLDDMNPLLAVTLMQFQYPPIKLNEIEVVGRFELSFELFQNARKWSMNNLQKAIISSLKKANESTTDKVKLHSAIASLLPRPEVLDVVRQVIGEDILNPDSEHDSDTTLLAALRFNTRSLTPSNCNDIVKASVGDKRKRFRILSHYRQELGFSEAGLTIGNYLSRKLFTSMEGPLNSSDYSGIVLTRLRSFLSSAINALFQESKIPQNAWRESDKKSTDCAVILDELISADDRDKDRLLTLLQQQSVILCFKEKQCGNKREQLINAIRSFYDQLLPVKKLVRASSQDWIECFEETSLDAKSKFKIFWVNLEQLMQIVTARYQDKRARVQSVLCAINESLLHPILKVCHESANYAFMNTLPDMLADKKTSVAELRRLAHLFSMDRLRIFFKENDFDAFGQLIQDYLLYRIQRCEVDGYLRSFGRDLSDANCLSSEKLPGIKLFISEFKSQSALLDFEPAQAFSGVYRYIKLRALANKILSTHYPYCRTGLSERSQIVFERFDTTDRIDIDIASLEKMCNYRCFLDSLVVRRPALKDLAFKMDRISRWDLTSGEERLAKLIREYEEITKQISSEDAQELLSALSSPANSELLISVLESEKKQFIEARLSDYIAKKAEVVSKPWFW